MLCFTKTSSYLYSSRLLRKFTHSSQSELCNTIKLISALSRTRAMSSFSRSIFDPEPNEDSSATTTTNAKVKEKYQLPNDKPWDGEESVADSVLRMVMDKYNKPLRVEGAARRQLPQPQTYSHHVQGLYDTDNKNQVESNMSSGEKAALRDNMARSKRQKRIMSARDAALDYSLEKKYPSQPTKQTNNNNSKEKEKQEEDESMRWPKSIAQMGLLAEERIRQARTEGHFDNLSGRGRPIPVDVNENNPFVDRTEFFLNRIVQRQGAAPPWIMMQQEVDTETTKFRTDLERSLRLYVTGVDSQQIATSSMALRQWRHNNQGYFTKLMESLNGRLRSYNVMCPASVRKTRLDLEDELQDIYSRITEQK